MKLIVWFLGMIWLFWKVKLFFFCSNRLNSVLSFLLSWHYEKVSSDFLGKIKGSYIIMSGLFLVMLGSNLWGLFPYIFGVTTQMVLTFSLSWVMWLCMVSSSMEYSMLKFLCHLTPQGSPFYLAPILNFMELVSKMIRPLTLALRLSMNMTTGHVLISLMSTSGCICLFSSKLLCFLIGVIMMGYLMFEVGMCFMQAFVFSLLSVQYLGEHS